MKTTGVCFEGDKILLRTNLCVCKQVLAEDASIENGVMLPLKQARYQNVASLQIFVGKKTPCLSPQMVLRSNIDLLYPLPKESLLNNYFKAEDSSLTVGLPF